MSLPPLYPLLTRPRQVQPIWGGTTLAHWVQLPEPRPARLGEIWLVYDGDPIANGPLTGQTLAEVTQTYAADLVGTRTIARYGAEFPLLAKFIDAADRLSLQVHPDDAYAHAHEAATGFQGKTEAWYMLRTTPDAEVVYGFARDTNRDEVAQALSDGTIEQLMNHVPVQAGAVLFVPAGTVHAINSGILLFEIQQKSDLTYRVYDYGRRDAQTGQLRTLHLDKALAVMDFHAGPHTTHPITPITAGRDTLVHCPFFALERWQLTTAQSLCSDSATFEIWTVIEGAAALTWEAGTLLLQLGAAVVIPACLGAYTLTPEGGAGVVLRAYVPSFP